MGMHASCPPGGSRAQLIVLAGVLAPHPFWGALYMQVLNGFSVNTLINRWVLRFWPTGAAPQGGLLS